MFGHRRNQTQSEKSLISDGEAVIGSGQNTEAIETIRKDDRLDSFLDIKHSECFAGLITFSVLPRLPHPLCSWYGQATFSPHPDALSESGAKPVTKSMFQDAI